MRKTKIAVDLDDVLVPHIAQFAKYLSKKYDGQVTLKDFKSDSWQLFGGTDDDDVRLVHEFYKTEEYTRMPPIRGASTCLHELKKDFDLAIVSSRPTILAETTNIWIGRHFPGIFDEIILGNIWALDGASMSKPEMCKQIGARVLIDDSIRYALECSGEGIGVLLFRRYPWNAAKSLPRNVLRVSGWKQVPSKINDLLRVLDRDSISVHMK